MPPEVWFYHLERSPLEAVLPPLLDKSLERGWKVLIRTPSEERVAALDEALWTYREEAFLPHGRADRPDAELQPVLLQAREGNSNGANVLVLIDGAEAPDISGYERVILLFDGQDESALSAARAKWAELKAQGLGLAYWQQSATGKWEKRG